MPVFKYTRRLKVKVASEMDAASVSFFGAFKMSPICVLKIPKNKKSNELMISNKSLMYLRTS